MPRVLRLSILLALLLLVGAGTAVADPVELRDIAISTTASSALISFSVAGKVTTVVLDRKENGLAQVRMRSMAASRTALASALQRKGVRSVKAHIERKDVLVTDIRFTREVRKLQVLRRDEEKIVVRVTLGDRLDSDGTGTSSVAAASPKRPRETSTSSAKNGSKSTTKVGDKGADKGTSVKSGSGKDAGDASATRGDDARKGDRLKFPLPDGVSLDSKRKWSLTTIVIDPGHGGKDPGAIGIDGVQEKDVTLAVARKLRDEIKRKMPEIEVVMTRGDDRFIELYRRGQIANQKGGRLFISIHCNSMPTKPHPATGFECYILRPGKSDDAARVAAAENSAIRFESDRDRYAKMATESAIMASMAQSAFVRYSERLAKAIRGELKGTTAIPDRGVHQAGFFVLVGASMPAMLLELGYLSNSDDVEVLTSDAGQTKLARGIFAGIREYEKIYSASLK